ncbi:MAG: laccase domain-containing protein, partial [Desulfobacterales bacterium]
MIERRENGSVYYQFPNLLAFPGIQHGVFTRKGGCSPAPFDSLNVSLGVGDQGDRVEGNRQMLSQWFGRANLVFLNQVHGDRIRVFSRKDGPGDPTTPLVGDAMVTDIQHTALVIQVADCQA